MSIATTGMATILGGIVVAAYQLNTDEEHPPPFFGPPMMLGGAVLAAIGFPMWIAGVGSPLPAESGTARGSAAVPRVAIGPLAASLAWSF